MRWWLTLLTLCAIAGGGFLGRYIYLREQGSREGFIDSVSGLFRPAAPASRTSRAPARGRPGKPAARKPAAEKGAAEKGEEASETAKETPPGIDPARLEEALAAARAAYERGRFGEAAGALEPLLERAVPGAAGPARLEDAARLAARGRAFAAVLEGVKVIPPPPGDTIQRVTLENGNTLFAVRVEPAGDRLRIETDAGIRFEWEKARLRLKAISLQQYRKEKRAEFEESLKGMDRSSYIALYRGARQAYRKGFPDRARALLEEALALEGSATLVTFFASDPSGAIARAWEVASGRRPPFEEVARAETPRAREKGDRPPGEEGGSGGPAPRKGSRPPPPPPSMRPLASALQRIRGGLEWYQRSIDEEADQANRSLRQALAELDGARKMLLRIRDERPELRGEAERRLGEIQILRLDCLKRLGFHF